jgi:hypothetical protein
MSTPSTTPNDAAVAHLRLIFAESFSTIDTTTFQQVVFDLGVEIIRATAKVHRRQAMLALLDDDTRIPKSARIAFQLRASDSVVAESAVFIAATQATNALIATFQAAIAAQVKIVAGLELRAVQLGRAKLVYRSICIWAKVFAILLPAVNLPAVRLVRVSASLACIQPLIVPLDHATRVSTELETLGAADAAAAEYDHHCLPSSEQQQQLLRFTDAVKFAVADTIDAFEKAHNDILVHKAARAYMAAVTRTESATSATTATVVDTVIGNEPPVSFATLQSLIKTAIAKKLEKLPVALRRNATGVPCCSNHSKKRQRSETNGAAATNAASTTGSSSSNELQRSRRKKSRGKQQRKQH